MHNFNLLLVYTVYTVHMFQLCYSINPAIIPMAIIMPIVRETVGELGELVFNCVVTVGELGELVFNCVVFNVQFPERLKTNFAKSRSDVSSLFRPFGIEQSMSMYSPNASA